MLKTTKVDGVSFTYNPFDSLANPWQNVLNFIIFDEINTLIASAKPASSLIYNNFNILSWHEYNTIK